MLHDPNFAPAMTDATNDRLRRSLRRRRPKLSATAAGATIVTVGPVRRVIEVHEARQTVDAAPVREAQPTAS